MNEKVNHILKKINRGLPNWMQGGLTRTEVDDSEEKLAREALDNRHVSTESKEKLKKHLEDGSLIHTEEVVNEDVTKQIDEYHTTEIKRAIEQGAIPDPMEDKFYRERVERARRLADGTERPRENKLPEVDKERAAWELRRGFARGREDNSVHKKYY